jgi:four helix bundle protein
MAAIHDVRDITAWRLAHQLNLRVDLFLLSPDFRRGFKSWDQLRVAVRCGPDQIAAGVDLVDRREFAQCVRLAKGSEQETMDLLVRALGDRLITPDEFELVAHVARRAMRAANRLIRSLESISA